MTETRQFPEGFLWGTATSAYQVEGGIENNDWAEAARRKKVPPAGAACDHYRRFREDFDIARKIRTNAHRFSIEWSRIEPKEGQCDRSEIAHYREVVSALKERGIEPFVTLWHWPLPLWLARQGGFENGRIVGRFARYAETVARGLPGVKFWVTINEPMVWGSHAYLKGNWPPQRKSATAYLKVLKNLTLCHRAAYTVIHHTLPSALVGIAKNNIFYEGILAPPARWWWNYWFLKKMRRHQDFVGINYYFHNRIRGLRFNQNENREVSDVGWEVYPKGIYHVLMEAARFQKPVYILENGIADAFDRKRGKFIKEHLTWVHTAIEKGADVRGYFYWSLLDNFEWTKGFGPRFGLVEVNYNTQARRIRPSAHIYGNIAEANALTIRE